MKKATFRSPSPKQVCLLREDHFRLLAIDLDDIFGSKVAFEDMRGQRILDFGLDRPLERPSPEDRVKTGFRDAVQCGIRDFQRHIHGGQTLLQILQLDTVDVADVLLIQRVEDDYIIDPVDELRTEE